MQCDRGYASAAIHGLGKDGRTEEAFGRLTDEMG